MTDFQSLGLSKGLLSAIAEIGYDTPTPIQEKAIPLVLQGKDLMGLAQTGTGKTAAFGVPLIDRLMEENTRPQARGTRALILAPTRELVNQIAKNLISFLKKTPLRVTSVVGGVSINAQIKRLSKGTDILVATPGRLLDLVDREAVDLGTASYLVLDEADQMLDLGFIHALRRIAGLVADERQTLLFSATMPRQISELAQSYLTDPERVEVSPAGRTADKISQSVHFMDRKTKTGFLVEQLQANPQDLSLVFCRTKHGAERLMRKLAQSGVAAGSIHGNKSQNQRDRAIRDLRNGDINVLVATDVAARGIDIPGVSHVYNFELPEVAEAYVHRIGRTARAGAEGEAVALCAPEEIGLFRQIEKLIGIEISVASGDVPPLSAAASRSQRGARNKGGKPGGKKPFQKRASSGDNDNRSRSRNQRRRQGSRRDAA
ncbi:MAG: DEAD/DEAH box helicase [Roseibium sp.]|uniref:DEAD/DEAH box helicase n=1 Tax=Roseibium sp. TaxID=1936156 RepID=UPI001B101D9D|nr:DEAD/DEAH box helicase [Roseibium sp.]MBO6890690.1 DEAD/DEAH box helicase [Roseibium sp.]MBO6931482.1 DEAD/DEAH box helicase [Roseibium sp.]